jgi:hypothetical protein
MPQPVQSKGPAQPSSSSNVLRAASPAPSVTSIKPQSNYIFSLVADDVEYEFELSRVGLLEGDDVNEADFEQNLISYDDFRTDGELVNDRNLVLRYRNRFVDCGLSQTSPKTDPGS